MPDINLTPLRPALDPTTTTDTPGVGTDRPRGLFGNQGVTYSSTSGSGDSDEVDDSPDIPPAGDSDPDKINNADKRIGDIFSAGGETFLGDAFNIMILFHKIAQSQRTTARESREIAREAQYSAIDSQKAQMEKAANFALAAGIVTGAFTAISGAINLGYSFSAARTLSANPTATTQVDLALGKGRGFGSITEGVGQMISSGLTYGSSMAQAQQKEFEKDETQAKAAIDNESEFVNNMLDIMRDVRQKMQEIANAQTESLRTIMRA